MEKPTLIEVPFVDLKAQYESLKSEINHAIFNCIENTAFIGGKQVKQFEKDFAAYTQNKYCIACANGTDSLEILLQAMGIGAGDEVLVPAISWISTAESVSSVGAVPVFVDIEEAYYTIDPSKIEEKITERTKAIVPVHLYGQSANMPAIIEIAKRYNLKVMEDCAQAHGASIEGKRIGTWGDCASFSFYPGKNLGAYGDAGGMVTNDEQLASISRMVAHHGQEGKHNHQMEGRNSRMDTIHAAVLNVKLPHIDSWNGARAEKAALYNQKLADVPQIICPEQRSDSKHVYHLYVIRTTQREALQAFLKEKGISTSIHYPTAMPFMPCYQKRFGHKTEDFPVAFTAQNQILSLPIFPELTEEQIDYVVEAIKAFFN